MRRLILALLLCAVPALPAVPATTGRTAWFNASDADHLWKTAGNPGTGTPANGEAVKQVDDEDGLDLKLFAEASGTTYTTSGIHSLGSLNMAGATYYYAQPDAGGSSIAASNFISVSAFTIFASVRITSDCTNASIYNDTSLVSDSTWQRFGLVCRTSAGVTSLCAYNFDGNADTACKTISQGTDYVVMIRHGGGNLYISINNGAESSAASGDADRLDGTLQISSPSPPWPGMFGEILIYNIALTGADFSNTYQYMTDKWLPAPSATRRRVIVIQ